MIEEHKLLKLVHVAYVPGCIILSGHNQWSANGSESTYAHKKTTRVGELILRWQINLCTRVVQIRNPSHIARIILLTVAFKVVLGQNALLGPAQARTCIRFEQ
jgi:hypothetical protein